MAHLLSANEGEEVMEAGEEAQASVSERLSPVEMPPSPAGEGDLHHRLGYLEATLRSQEELLRQHKAISEQQASEVARLAAQTEIQEEQIAKKTAQVTAQEREPSLWEKVFGGHNRSSSPHQEQE